MHGTLRFFALVMQAVSMNVGGRNAFSLPEEGCNMRAIMTHQISTPPGFIPAHLGSPSAWKRNTKSTAEAVGQLDLFAVSRHIAVEETRANMERQPLAPGADWGRLQQCVSELRVALGNATSVASDWQEQVR